MAKLQVTVNIKKSKCGDKPVDNHKHSPGPKWLIKCTKKYPLGSAVSMSGSLYTKIPNTKQECQPFDYKIPSHQSVPNNLTFDFSRLVFESV